MKTFNTLFRDFKQLQDVMQAHEIIDDPHLLVRVHTGVHTKETIQPFLSELCHLLPQASIIGGSHIAIIYNSEILFHECLISFTYMPSIQLQTAMFTTKNTSATALAANVEKSQILKDAKAGLLFLSSTFHKVSRFIQACDEFAKGVTLIGGITHDSSNTTLCKKEEGFVFVQDQVSTHAAVFCSMKGDPLYTYGNAIFGVEQIGQTYQITKSDGLYIDEINHQDASLWYRNLLDKDAFEKEPEISKVFPFVLPDEECGIRTVFYDTDKKKIHWVDDVIEQQNIRIGYCSPKVSIEQCRSVCQDLETVDAESLFVYSCITRNDIMHQCCKWELTPFKDTCIAGALCAGEICNVNGKNVYGNSTCSLLALGQQKDVHLNIHKDALDQVDDLEYDNQHILTYLLKTTSDDMYKTNASLSRQILEQNNQMMENLFVDSITKLPNLTKFLYDKDHMEFNKICMISTQNAAMLRSHYGDQPCNQEIVNKVQRTREFLNDPELYIYQYNQDRIMILALTNYDDEIYLKKIKGLFTYLGTIESKQNGFYYVNEFAVVIHEKDILEKVELTLSYVERSSQRFLLYYPNLGLEDQIEEELQCLSHIKYAILHDSVEPYFQPIHDNKYHTIQKYESLMRLRTKDGDILYPNQFLDTAKKFKLYEELSRQMIGKVMNLYIDSEDCVTINLSEQDIYSDTTKALIYSQLQQTKTPQNIVFEIVESEEIHKDNILEEFIHKLRHYGAKIAIDDFGSGYSNLLKLVKLNADYIKIDGEIIRNMLEDETCHKILDTILFLSKQTHTELIAEFVETSEIQEEIESMGIRFSQGYHFSRPKPYTDFHPK